MRILAQRITPAGIRLQWRLNDAGQFEVWNATAGRRSLALESHEMRSELMQMLRTGLALPTEAGRAWLLSLRTAKAAPTNFMPPVYSR